MVLDDLLDLGLDFGGDGASGDLGEEGLVRAGEVSTELAFPAGDLVDGDGVELEAVMELVRSKCEDANLRTRPLTPA